MKHLLVLTLVLLCCATPGTAQAKSIFTKLAEHFLDEPQAELDAAEKLFREGNYEAALKGAENHLKHAPKSLQATTLKAWCLMKLDREEEAKPLIEHALRKEPDNVDTLVAMGVYYRITEDYDQAVRYYEQALEIDPDYAQALTSVLVVALLNGEIGKAVTYGERAWKNDHYDPVVAANLAVAYHYAGNFEKRDSFTKKAEKLGYNSLDTLEQIYNGEIIIVPEDKLKQP